ncbi:MAG: hypothetical protein K2X66_09370, partial [Cyanobacteria bacterium]|nr:hypothetical protein [Cyanobacteriota bacterium]
MPIVLTECLRSKSANARIRDGQIHLKIPKKWPKAYKQQVAESLVERVLRRHAKENKQLEMLNATEVERITITSQKELEAYVHQLNSETFRVPLGPIRIGTAKYTRLA